jgi:predicted nucleic acid-binding protein
VIIVLDAGPVGLIANPSGRKLAIECQEWLINLPFNQVLLCVPEIADYEVRRELIRRNSAAALARLDALIAAFTYLAIDTATLRRAAELWAAARNRGVPTADRHALDADVILAAQAQLLHEATGDQVVVASDNIRHLAQFVDTRRWQEIEP